MEQEQTHITTRKRILCVDDDPLMRSLASRLLAREGYVVTTAADGVEGWEELNKLSYDLLITDHEMPRMTGLQLIAKVRAATMGIPIILASGQLYVLSYKEMGEAEGCTMLPKPFNRDRLLTAVREAMESATGTNRLS